MPFSLQINSTSPNCAVLITLHVDTSSLVISSRRAERISGSTFNFKVVLSNILGASYFLVISFAALLANTKLSNNELLASLFFP